MSKLRLLNEKQRRFVLEYAKTFNGQQAAEAAGYARASARVTASKLLTTANIKSALDELCEGERRRMEKEFNLTKDQIIKELAQIGFLSLGDTRILEGTVKVKDKLYALIKLGEHLGLFVDATPSTLVIQPCNALAIVQERLATYLAKNISTGDPR